ncbi:MAG: antibiotic biosynthesis monooxygenase family protein [Pseudomonadota bacterium]
MIIVRGWLSIKPGQRETFIERSLDAVRQARALPACHDFSVSPDPIDENRVNILEIWESPEALNTFRGKGPGDDLSALITGAHVKEHKV